MRDKGEKIGDCYATLMVPTPFESPEIEKSSTRYCWRLGMLYCISRVIKYGKSNLSGRSRKIEGRISEDEREGCIICPK